MSFQSLFSTGCHALIQAWRVVSSTHYADVKPWEDVKLCSNHGIEYLRITRALHITSRPPSTPVHKDSHIVFETDDDGDHDEITLDDGHEDDEGALRRTSHQIENMLVLYDLVYSSSFQTPVIYMTFRTTAGQPAMPSLSFVHDHIVSRTHRAGLKQIPDYGAPFGALSLTDHPILHRPALFVHPCLTRETMLSIAGGVETVPVLWLLAFIGTIGGAVGLDVPLPVARYLTNRQDTNVEHE